MDDLIIMIGKMADGKYHARWYMSKRRDGKLRSEDLIREDVSVTMTGLLFALPMAFVDQMNITIH